MTLLARTLIFRWIHIALAIAMLVNWYDETTGTAYAVSRKRRPTKSPTSFPSKAPVTSFPTSRPTFYPTHRPTSQNPTRSPTPAPTKKSSLTNKPSPAPSKQPTLRPTTAVPSKTPTQTPTLPTSSPTSPTTNAPTSTVTFFNSGQSYSLNNASLSSNTLTTEGYKIQYSQDKLFTGGLIGPATGRFNYPVWPTGLHCQAITTGVVGNANFKLSRVDKKPFTINSMTLQLRANTYGAGGDFEVTAQLAGNDLNGGEPYYFSAIGVAGNNFVIQSAVLSGADTYSVALYADFAIMNLQVTVD